MTGGERGPSRWSIVGTRGISLLVCVAAAATLGACSDPPVRTFRNVALGMKAHEIRRYFDQPGPGAWRAESSDVALVWRSAIPLPGAPIERVRFELHDLELVAVRARVRGSEPIARGPAVEVDEQAVVSRKRGPDAVEVALLARDCPNQAEEVRRLVALAR